MTILVVAFLFPLFRSAEHEVDAALVVEIDVSGGVARLAAADAGVKVQPLPGVTSGNQSQNVNVDVVEATCCDDFSRFGEFLVICPELSREVVIGGRVPHLALDHRRVTVHVLLDVVNNLPPVFVVTLFTAGEVETETPVVTSSVSANVLDVVRGKL